MREDGSAFQVIVPVDRINAIDDRDAQACLQCPLLELIDHTGPGGGCIDSGESSSTAEQPTDK